jgi:hypothetical protein
MLVRVSTGRFGYSCGREKKSEPGNIRNKYIYCIESLIKRQWA